MGEIFWVIFSPKIQSSKSCEISLFGGRCPHFPKNGWGGGKYFQKSEKYSVSRSSLSKGNLIGRNYSFETKKYSVETFCEGSKGKIGLQNVQNMYSLVKISKELSKLWSN